MRNLRFALTCILLLGSSIHMKLFDSTKQNTLYEIQKYHETQPVLHPYHSVGDDSLLFIENIGQFEKQARYQVWGADPDIYLDDNAIWYTLRKPQNKLEYPQDVSIQQVNLRLSFPGANPKPEIEPFDRQPIHISYFRGNSDLWQSDVPVWSGARYLDLYPGIDLLITGRDGRLDLSIVCRKNCTESLSNVRIRIEGAQEGSISKNSAGQPGIILDTPAGKFDLPLFNISGHAALRGTLVTIDDKHTIELINPFQNTPYQVPDELSTNSQIGRLVYSTFLSGDDGGETGYDIQVDASGAAYVVGNTSSPDFPVSPGAITKPDIDADIFIVKINPSGSNLVYAAILGGTEGDAGKSIDIDSAGSVYITGSTYSPDFPTTPGAYDQSCGMDGNCDASGYNFYPDVYVAKLNANGTSLVYSTFIGGEDTEEGDMIDVVGGEAYVIGNTQSDHFPTTPGAMDHGSQNFGTYVSKLNSTGTDLLYSTFMPSTYCPFGACAIAVDPMGYAYIAGTANLSLFPFTPGAFDTTYGEDEAFIAKLNQAGTGVEYATFVGGSGVESAWDIAIDPNGNAYLVGSTVSPDFPTTLNAYDRTCGNDGNCLDGYAYPHADVYVIKMNSTGTGIWYGTYLGGSDSDCETFATINKDCTIAIDTQGNAYIGGGTSSTDFPLTQGAIDTYFEGYTEAYAAKLNSNGTELEYATLLGGFDEETVHGITVDQEGMVYVTGGTGSDDFPVTLNSFDPFINWLDGAAFISKLDMRNFTTVSATIPTSGGTFYSESDNTTYEFPPQTFPSTTVVTHTIYSQGSVANTGLLSGINHFFSGAAAYTNTGDPAEPEKQFTIIVQYDEAELGVVREDTLNFYAWEGNQWNLLAGSQLDTEHNTITLLEDEFRLWALLGKKYQMYLPIIQESS